jgi:hypothetical protein
MLRKATALWVIGLVTAVPYATWYLFFRAPRDHYALLITFVLFWIFGYWGIAGPLLSLVKVRTVFRAIEHATSREEVLAIFRSDEATDVAIDHIASEYRIPRFVAARVIRLLGERLNLSSGVSERDHRIDTHGTTTSPARTERD